MKKYLSIALAALMVCLMSVSAFAAEVNNSGGAGTTPVFLSSTSDGSLGGNPSPTAMSVTVPTALPMAMSQTGDVTTATDCKIINHSYGAVRVKSVTISTANGWKLTAFGDKAILASEKVDSNKLDFAMTIGGGAMVKTAGTYLQACDRVLYVRCGQYGGQHHRCAVFRHRHSAVCRCHPCEYC